MNYKIISMVAAAAAVLLGTAACNKVKEKEFDPKDPAVMTIVAQPEALALEAVRGSATVTFTAPDYWFVSSPVDWLEFEPESGKPGEVTLTVKGKQNIGALRDALVTITAKTQRGEFKVNQDAWPYGAGNWQVAGTVNGGEPVAMEDKDNGLVWGASNLAYNADETFKFRMGASDATLVGLSGALTEVEGAETLTLQGPIVDGGTDIVLPEEGFWDVTMDLKTWTVTAVFVDKLPIPVDVDGTLIWDQKVIFDSWSATTVIPAENFAPAQEGQLIRVYFVNKGSDFNPVFKHVEDWSDWTDLQGGMVKEEEYFEAAITTDALAELQEKGLRFQGVGFTLVAVSLVDPPVSGETVIWDTETVFDSWSATAVIPASGFANAEEGDKIRVIVSGKGGDYNPIFKHVDDWSDWAELQGAKKDGEDFFEAAIPAGALEELQTKGLRFQGVGFTLVKVILVKAAVVIWDTETAFDSWSATLVIPAEMFAEAEEGQVIRGYVTNKGGDYNPIFKHVDDWSDWAELQGAINKDGDEYFEAAIPAEAVEELKAKGLRFQGVGFTLTKVVLK